MADKKKGKKKDNKKPIKFYKIEMVPVSKIKTDPENPNKMSPEQLNGLEKFMEDYGFMVPVVLTKNYVIADGEQRYTILKRRGEKMIPSVVVPLEKVGQRIVRYILNEMGGENDQLKLAYEFEQILKAGRLDDTAEYLARQQEEFLKILETARDMVSMEGDEQKDLNLDNESAMEIILKYDDLDKYEIVLKHLKKINSESPANAVYDLVKKDLAD
jgi:ParB-like chromosome segregation protein Spo0J